MKYRKKWIYYILIGFGWAFPVVVSGQGAHDIVFTFKGEQVEGKIIKEDFKEVTLQLAHGRGEKKIPWTEIQNIRYSHEPKGYSSACGALTQGNYQQAIDEFGQLLKDHTKFRPIFYQHILFKLACAYQGKKSYNQALEKYDTLLKEVPDTLYFKNAWLNKINIYLSQNLPDEALKTVEKAQEAVRQVKMDEEFYHYLGLTKGKIIEQIKKLPQDALVIYTRLEKEAGKYPKVAEHAVVGKARCLFSLGKPEAEQIFKDIAERSRDFSVLASAYLGLGDCYLKKAETGGGGSLAIYKKALMCYLRTWVRYRVHSEEHSIDYSRAGYQAGYCFEVLSNMLKEREQQENYRIFARNIYLELINHPQYKNTPWAEEAKKRLKQLGQ